MTAIPDHEERPTDSGWWEDALACPDCQADARLAGGEVRCDGCSYRRPRGSPLDLRPHEPVPRRADVLPKGPALEGLTSLAAGRPRITYDGPRAERDSAEIFSPVTSQLQKGQAMLDLGCGPRDQAVVAEHLGLRYVGIDYASPRADVLADAHAIPFRADTFDVVLSYAVLEHLYNPFLAAGEVARVLRPGGLFIGTVSQGEPFHDSYFHHTTWGVLSVFSSAGLGVQRLWPSYDTLRSLSQMGRYPVAIRAGLRTLDWVHESAPFLSPRKAMRWSESARRVDELHRAASICFVAARPGGSRDSVRAGTASPSS